MSKKPSETPTKPKGHQEHGTTASYIVGFILSLIFTAIPYYMVVNKTVTGRALLATLLGFAVWQMLIQIFFFLHLGRGPKPLYNVVFFVSTAGIIIFVVTGSIFIMDHLHANMAPIDVTKKLAQDEGIAEVGGKKTGACDDIGENHKVTIKGGVATPSHVNARLCDSLSFINEDSTVHDIAFGKHPAQDIYGGESGETVRTGYPKTVTLNQEGTYEYHDHLNPDTHGFFTVEP
jgi:cytochrome o ubiquinol oxidase operon protein cyoD